MSLAACAEQADPLASLPPSRMTPVVKAVHAVMPAVANIATQRVVRVRDPFESFFNEFFGAGPRYREYEYQSLGSGVIVDPAGLVLTNHHVVRRASNIEVRLWQREPLAAHLVAFDRNLDLALLRLHPDEEDGQDDFRAIPFARPGDLILGETVVAVGNPFGLEHSVTTGVLSAKNRHLQAGNMTFENVLQTDAAVNPGNSGGPLINVDGELVGLNIAIRRDANGIGFAIPLHRIENVLAGWLVPSRFAGANCGFTPKTVVRNGRVTAVAGSVQPKGPAAEAGLEEGDRLTRVNGRSISRALDVARILWKLTPGASVALTLESGREIRFAVEPIRQDAVVRQRLGVQLQPLTPALRKALGLPESVSGLTISEVLPGSDLDAAPVGRGDILFAVNNTPVTSIEDLAVALKDVDPGDRVPVYLLVTQRFHGELLLQKVKVPVTVQ